MNEIARLKGESTSALSSFKTNLETVNVENKIINELNDKISEIFKNKFTGDDFNLLEYIKNFNDWFNSLEYSQNIAIINLFGIFVIIISLFSIISIFYGNKIIDYLGLEYYPWLTKFIALRRKFQNFYLLINIFLITVISIIMFWMNLTLIL